MTQSAAFYTIGVYGSTSEEFFDKLVSNEIDVFIDIRRRRAVRGSKYSFVNSKRLQDKLRELGIKYFHILDLAPTNEIRSIQNEADKTAGILKRERNRLGDKFIEEYTRQILADYNFSDLINKLDEVNAHKAVLFCVEKEAEACHRSLVADKLEQRYSVTINHL
jgi:uncharacterized protein (DUF488 family)